MYTGYIVENTRAILDIKLPKQEDVEKWILVKLKKCTSATGILIDNKTGKPIREYHSAQSQPQQHAI